MTKITPNWAIIGAGPAGIAAIGKLIDNGIPPKEIFWVDPAFAVGDFGKYWRYVPSNTKVDLFLKFLRACNAFHYDAALLDFALNHLNPEDTCQLEYMVQPLQWITEQLQTCVTYQHGFVHHLDLAPQGWYLDLNEKKIYAKNVILATGAEPKILSYAPNKVISLYDALNPARLKNISISGETIGVFGSSHSAVLILRSLLEDTSCRVINFYRSPIVYAIYFDDWILFDDTGLKGSAAAWAKSHLNGQSIPRLQRVYANEANIAEFLPKCDRLIYAVGLNKRMQPSIEKYSKLNYYPQIGIIAPGLFGLGIAFPEAKYNPVGILEYRVGLWKFMQYLERVLPLWLNYSA